METDPAKLQVVLEWLKSTYGNTPAPSFEVNPGTVAVLYDLAIKNQKANAEAEVEIELLRKVATEAALQTRQTDETLKALGLRVQELPDSVRMYIKALSAVATAIGISDSELTSFYPAIREVLNQNQLAIKCREAEKSAYEALIAKLRDAIAILNEAQQLYSATQSAAPQREQQVLKELQNIDYMENKRREYQTKNSGLQNHQSEEVARLNGILTPKLQSLKVFGELPPDVTLANAKIQDAKIRLVKLEQQLRHQINTLEL